MSRRAVLLSALESAPADLRRLCAHVAAQRAHVRPADGEWCAAEIVAHLCDIETRYRERFEQVLSEADPDLPPLLPRPEAYDPAAPLAGLVVRFAAERQATLTRLRTLPPGDWQRPATKRGQPTTLRWLVQGLVEHDTEHLTQLATVRQRLEARR